MHVYASTFALVAPDYRYFPSTDHRYANCGYVNVVNFRIHTAPLKNHRTSHQLLLHQSDIDLHTWIVS